MTQIVPQTGLSAAIRSNNDAVELNGFNHNYRISGRILSIRAICFVEELNDLRRISTNDNRCSICNKSIETTPKLF